MDGKPLVSIIVPVYNIEKYVGNCLESLIKQTYKNIEIIVIDDNSTDKSLSICQKFKEKDSRIKIIKNNNNLGLSLTRNVGMQAMTGDYVMFVDGDDWIDDICVEECVKCMKNENDICIFPFKKEYTKKTIKVDLFDSVCDFSEEEIDDLLLRKLFGLYRNELRYPVKMDNFSSVWGKMYKKNIIKNKEFIDTKKIGTEDGIMNIVCFKDAKKVSYINNVFYHYRRNNSESLTHIYDRSFFCRWKNLYKEMDKYSISDSHKEALNNRIVINVLTNSLKIVSSDLNLLEQKKELDEILNDDVMIKSFESFDFKYLSMPWRVFYGFCKRRMSLGVILFDSSILLYKRMKWGNI